ncbi:MmgE/PrpD family protein [Thermodesulfobacteriota bacterium]
MDTIAEYIASYGASIGYEDLPPEVIHKVKCLLIDSLACALGGYDSEPSRIARRIAGRVYKCDMPATIIGSGEKSSPELATFANGTMIRYLDFNDGFCGKSAGHPSDNFGPVLTCADAVGAGGREVIVASVLAYEVFCRLSDRFDLKGFDQAVTGVISCVMGASKIFSLSFKQMVEAANLAITPNISLLQTRLGELSMWKGCALANAARNAVFASFLAKEGMTGPSPVFEGRAGFFKVISGPFQLEEFGGKGSPFRIMDVLIKRYPCGMFAQTAIDAAIKLRLKIPSLNEIAAVNIGTFELGKTVMAGDDYILALIILTWYRRKEMEVGNRVRELRKRVGITQKQLAEKIGVSPPSIYRIETGKVSPSVAILSEIAICLNYPISTFLVPSDKSVIHLKSNEQPVIKGNNLELKLISPRGVIDENISIFIGKAEKGEIVSTHKNVGFELAYVLKGKAIFIQDNKKYELDEGDMIYHDGQYPHSVIAMEYHEFLGIHFIK